MRRHRLSSVAALILTAGVVVPVAFSGVAGAVTIFHPPASIDHAASCSSSALRDESATVNSWLSGLRTHPGDIVQLAANQCYRTDETVLLAHKSGITFDGNGATFASFDDARLGRRNAHLKVQGDTNVTVENLNIVGSASGGYFPKLEAQHGFYVLGGTGVTINHVTVNGVYGDFVALQRDSRRVTPTGITIENSRFGAASTSKAGAGRQELTIDDGIKVLVINNYFGHGSRSAVDIEPTSIHSKIRNITIAFNTFGPNPNYWFSNHGLGARISSVYFLYNTLINRPMRVTSVDPNSAINRTDYRFVGNVSTTTQTPRNCQHGHGQIMRFVGVSSLIITSNTQRMETTTNHTCRYFVHGNHIIGASVTSNHLQKVREVAAFDSSSHQVCEGSNYFGRNFPALQLAPIDPRAALCPGRQAG